MPLSLWSPVAGARHPLANRSLADAQGAGDLTLGPALLLEVPRLQPSGFFPIVRWLIHASQGITALTKLYLSMSGSVVEMFLPRGLILPHEAVREWERKLAPLLSETLRKRRHGAVGKSWYVDETSIKVQGQWCYLVWSKNSNASFSQRLRVYHHPVLILHSTVVYLILTTNERQRLGWNDT
jgi:hypothetical protein